MNKLITTVCTAALLSASAAAMGHSKDDCKAMHMKAMDANHDGMISKDEYMNAMTMKWDKMQKNKDGMVTMKDMEMMHKEMHKDCDDKMDSMEK